MQRPAVPFNDYLFALCYPSQHFPEVAARFVCRDPQSQGYVEKFRRLFRQIDSVNDVPVQRVAHLGLQECWRYNRPSLLVPVPPESDNCGFALATRQTVTFLWPTITQQL